MKLNMNKNLTNLSLMTIIFLTLIGMIPLSMISSLIGERNLNKSQVEREINSQWGDSLEIGRFSIGLPYKYTEIVKITDYRSDDPNRNEVVEKSDFYYYSAHQSKNKIIADVQKRYKGIYSVPIYNAKVESEFEFKDIKFEKHRSDHILQPENGFIYFGLGQGKEVSNVKLFMNGEEKEVQSVGDGIGLPLNLNEIQLPLKFKMSFDYKGTKRLSFFPTAKHSHYEIAANWKDPKFIGDRLPNTREITDEGFYATWDITNFTKGNNEYTNQVASGVELFDVLDVYQINERTLKYGALFIFLTFLGFFVISIINKVDIHPIQYGFIMGSMIEFYFLLLSFSEHVNFSFAYVIASIATIGTITLYARSVFNSKKESNFILSELILLYGFLYMTIMSKDYALLTGSIGLFIILSVSMFATRNVKWRSPETQATV